VKLSLAVFEAALRYG